MFGTDFSLKRTTPKIQWDRQKQTQLKPALVLEQDRLITTY